MKTRFADYELAGAVMIAGALVFTSVGIFTDRGDLTTATLVLSGVACFVCGLYLLTFSRGESFDPRVAALLPVQANIDVCTLCTELGAAGNGHVLPGRGEAPVHFVPVAEYREPEISAGRVFLIEGEGGHGIALSPAGLPLFTALRKEYGLSIPHDESGILSLLEEAGQRVLSLAGSVQTMRSGENIVVELRDFTLAEGCRALRKASPRCCSIYPCPVCSLFACLLAEGSGKAVTLDRAVLEGSTLRVFYLTAG